MSREIDVKALVSHIVRGDGADKCRICMGDTSEGQVYLGDTVMMDGEKPVTLSELLEVITGVQMETAAQLPGGICSACTQCALECAPFVQRCRDADKRWRQITNYLHDLDKSVPKHAKSLCVVIGDEFLKITDSVVKNKKGAYRVIRNKLKLPPSDGRALNKELQCPECRQVYSSLRALNKHLKDVNMKMCGYCKVIIGTSSYPRHLKTHNVEVHNCKTCAKTFTNEGNFSRHMLVCKKYAHACPECPRTFNSASKLVTHSATKHKSVVCDACGKKFVSKVCFKNHMSYCVNSKPVSTSQYICDYCGKAYSFKGVLKLHIQFVHLTGWPFQCELCGKKFSALAHLKEHDNTHNRVEDRYVCSMCGAKYSTRRGYERHYKRHFDESGTQSASVVPLKKKREMRKMYQCVLCNYVSRTEKSLEGHLKIKHNIVALKSIQVLEE